MSRKGPAIRRELTPDPVYRSTVVTQLVNKVLQRGKRSTAERIVYSALAALQDLVDELGDHSGPVDRIRGQFTTNGRALAWHGQPSFLAP